MIHWSHLYDNLLFISCVKVSRTPLPLSLYESSNEWHNYISFDKIFSQTATLISHHEWVIYHHMYKRQGNMALVQALHKVLQFDVKKIKYDSMMNPFIPSNSFIIQTVIFMGYL